MSARGIVILSLLCLVSLSFTALAADYGDGFAVGGVLMPSGDPVILGGTRLGDAMGLEVGVGIDVVSEDDDRTSDFIVSGAMRRFWKTEEQFQPFFGGRLSLLYVEDGNDETLIGLSVLFGGEYFVSKRVSIRGEIDLGIYFGSIRVRTGTALGAFMYL
jgi:hypothetical protein